MIYLGEPILDGSTIHIEAQLMEKASGYDEILPEEKQKQKVLHIEGRCITSPAAITNTQKLNPKKQEGAAELDGFPQYGLGVRKLQRMRERQQEKRKQAEVAAAECVKDRMKDIRRSRD